MGDAQRRATGRQHHLGLAPEVMPVWSPDGRVTLTRTSPVQLAAQNDHQLRRLTEAMTAEMTRAAERLDFEKAAALRDEIAVVQAELHRRSVALEDG